MSFHFLTGFCITVFVASIIPGPSMLLALTHGMRYGAVHTMASALGNVAVTLVQALVSIVGLGTILLASESVFLVIKWAGAVYLVYMGWSVLTSSALYVGKTTGQEASCNIPSFKKRFFQAAAVTAGNPKAIVFFTAVFPQFITPGSGYLIQGSMLLMILALIAFACFMLYALGGEKIVAVFSGVRTGQWIKRVIGTSFIGAGIGLAFSRR
ncbi:MAG: LysE family translocator [Desulfobacterales bacterium]|nr:LysE family translocator [Desulfobacterales bacterium]